MARRRESVAADFADNFTVSAYEIKPPSMQTRELLIRLYRAWGRGRRSGYRRVERNRGSRGSRRSERRAVRVVRYLEIAIEKGSMLELVVLQRGGLFDTERSSHALPLFWRLRSKSMLSLRLLARTTAKTNSVRARAEIICFIIVKRK